MVPEEEEKLHPFVRGSVYRLRSIGTQDAATETTGTFRGFTNLGMGGEGIMMELSEAHGEDKGRLRIIPLHVVMHIDVLEQKEENSKKQDEGHPVSYS